MMLLLEYAPWFLAFLSCLLYGKSVRDGALTGIVSALLFIIWGTLHNVPAAVVTNVGFLGINSYNLWRIYWQKKVRFPVTMKN